MNARRPDFDAVVVGARVAGCTAARLYAQRGARVALVERRPDLDAYKTVCTHYIQPSATPTIERLGLAGPIEERGASATSSTSGRRTAAGSATAATRRTATTSPAARSTRCCGG
jgi:flavin-dependent dehydrogenase